MKQSEVDSVGQAASSARSVGRVSLEPMDCRLGVQPGGGIIVKLELAWGRYRRWYLKTFRRSYVARMRRLRQGNYDSGRFEVLDPRDLKYCRNQTDCYWSPEDDPFRWRARLPFARAGLAELLVFSAITFAPAGLLTWLVVYQPLSGPVACLLSSVVVALVIVGALIVWFFRDPQREIPSETDAVVSPADGKIVAISEVDHNEFIDGPAVMIGIFLSIFNVHINRMPIAARVIGLRYRPGKYLNALRPESARENERLSIRIEEADPPYRRMIVRQISGAIARRIVCWLKPGDDLDRGEQFGMIKLGSRTELILPREACLEIEAAVGQKVKAGSTILARYHGADDQK